MDRYFFTARSITHAQQMARALEQVGIGVKIRRAGALLSDRGCAYALEIGANNYLRARRRLSEARLRPVRVFLREGGVLREVLT